MDYDENNQMLVQKLIVHANQKGYLTFDNILEITDKYAVSIDDLDRITEQLFANGCIIKDDEIEELVEKNQDNFIDRSKLDYNEIFDKVIELDYEIKSYIDKVRKIIPPQLRETDQLIYQAKNGNAFARERIILMYLKIVIRIALWASEKYKIEIADAIQDGNIGLIIALNKFDLTRDDKFSTYAPWWIRQYILRKMQIKNYTVYFPAHVKDTLISIYDNVKYLDDDNSGDGFDDITDNEILLEIMKQTNVNENTAKLYIQYLKPRLSYEEISISKEELFTDEGKLEDSIAKKIDSLSLENIIKEMLSGLKPNEKEVLTKRFGLNTGERQTLEQVGKTMNVTRERIRQIEVKAIKRLRHPSRSHKLKDFY